MTTWLYTFAVVNRGRFSTDAVAQAMARGDVLFLERLLHHFTETPTPGPIFSYSVFLDNWNRTHYYLSGVIPITWPRHSWLPEELDAKGWYVCDARPGATAVQQEYLRYAGDLLGSDQSYSGYRLFLESLDEWNWSLCASGGRGIILARCLGACMAADELESPSASAQPQGRLHRRNA